MSPLALPTASSGSLAGSVPQAGRLAPAVVQGDHPSITTKAGPLPPDLGLAADDVLGPNAVGGRNQHPEEVT